MISGKQPGNRVFVLTCHGTATGRKPAYLPPKMYCRYILTSGRAQFHLLDAMSAARIGDDTLVVAYDDAGGTVAARLWWALRYYGHPSVKVLNGGIRSWKAEGRGLSIDVPSYQAGVHTASSSAAQDNPFGSRKRRVVSRKH